MPLPLRVSHPLPFLCALLLALFAPPCLAIDEDDLLPVDEAFVLSARAVAANRIEVNWKIADGYYLYRHRMDVQRIEEGFKNDPVRLPAGKKHHDEFFGDVETYRDSVTAVVTGAPADGMRTLTLQVKRRRTRPPDPPRRTVDWSRSDAR
jgi:thiol:disulfide interchange protein DsbD